MIICELTVRVDPDTVSCANICRGPSSVYRAVFSVPFSKWMIVTWGSFIFDLDVFIHALCIRRTPAGGETATPAHVS